MPPKKGTEKYNEWKNSLEYADYIQKQSESHKGQKAWNKGIKNPEFGDGQRGEKNPMFGRTGDKNPNYNGACCTNEWRKKQSESHKGQNAWNKGKTCPQISGEKNGMYGKCRDLAPGWKGGISFEPYCPKFNEPFKKRVRARYNNICAECGKTKEENGRELDVHHVDFDKQTCCKTGELITDQKFVALCIECHRYATNHKTWAIEHYTLLVIEKYEGKSYLSKEEMKDYIKFAPDKIPVTMEPPE